jgi:PAS domain S-box-containing protein
MGDMRMARLRCGLRKNEIEVAVSLLKSNDNRDVFRLIVDQSPDAVIFADGEGRIQVWNNAAFDLFGYPADEVIGQSLDVIIPEHLRHAHWRGFGEAVASGHTKHGSRALKTRATHRTGQRLYVTLAFAVVKDQGGEVVGAMATAREFIDKP